MLELLLAWVGTARGVDDALAKIRQTGRSVDGAIAALAEYSSRAEQLGLRAPIVQDLLRGLLAAAPRLTAGVTPTPAAGRPVLDAERQQQWPPAVGESDKDGNPRRIGELADLGLALTFEEVRAFIIGLAQQKQPQPAARQQIARVARALVAVVSRLKLDLGQYESAWTRLFREGIDGPISLSDATPNDIGAGSSPGLQHTAARADHIHGHGDQGGGTLHTVATPAAAGFQSAADKSKLDGIAAGATATPLAGVAPPSVAPASAVGSGTSAARADHTHAHGNQGGGTLHAVATPAAAGFLSAADKVKLDGLGPGSAHLQDIQLCASRTNQLLPGSSFGVDGVVELFSLFIVPDVCTVAGTLKDWWVEAQFGPNVPITITILKTAKTGGFFSTTPVTLTVPTGQVWQTSATTLAVVAGDRIAATSSGTWNHGGLVVRARLEP